jgi:hypothetical protein
MKKFFTILILCLSFSFNLWAQILPVPLIQQEQSEWCWAGVSKCLLDYYQQPLRQCDIADYTRTSAIWHSFGSQNCCDNPTGSCNYWNYPFDTPGSIQDIIKHFKNVNSTSRYDSLKIVDVRIQISNFRPFIARWLWNGTSNGHFVVGHGIVDKTLYYMNPWFGEGMKMANYDWVRYNSEHTWTHTLVLTTNPTILTVSASTLTIEATANSTKTFDITSNISWTAVSDQNWLTVSSPSGLGSTTLTLTAAANPANATRTASVTLSATGVSSKIITITQTENGITAIKSHYVNSLSMYPNPVTNELTITDIEQNARIEIYDLAGKLLISKIAHSTTEKIDVSNLENGVYSVKVSESKDIKIGKLLKQ